ncbi:hypothetical protein [Nonomuraea sp. NPDC049480]|uniref:hypothetical protein n=1 Tax=Nonomuraea sp. NPDC049480 TaxID=3364353 RepID=UPI0037B3E23B
MAQAGSDPDDGDEVRAVASLPMTQILNLTSGAIDSDWLLSLPNTSAVPAEPESMPS